MSRKLCLQGAYQEIWSPRQKSSPKKKLVIKFFVEMKVKDAWELVYQLDTVRHKFNELRHWDISVDIPNFTIEEVK
jgi:hypothetical protein